MINKTELREDGLYVWCSAEETYRPEQEFDKYQSIKTIYFTNCKQCGGVNSLRMKNEKQISIELLKSLGYDTESETPIHVQFNIKHNL
jgi:translation initiation factor 2 beta subunit (eIF-2beta)/eIF-5